MDAQTAGAATPAPTIPYTPPCYVEQPYIIVGYTVSVVRPSWVDPPDDVLAGTQLMLFPTWEKTWEVVLSRLDSHDLMDRMTHKTTVSPFNQDLRSLRHNTKEMNELHKAVDCDHLKIHMLRYPYGFHCNPKPEYVIVVKPILSDEERDPWGEGPGFLPLGADASAPTSPVPPQAEGGSHTSDSPQPPFMEQPPQMLRPGSLTSINCGAGGGGGGGGDDLADQLNTAFLDDIPDDVTRLPRPSGKLRRQMACPMNSAEPTPVLRAESNNGDDIPPLHNSPRDIPQLAFIRKPNSCPCYEEACDGDCGTMSCGCCIDVCRCSYRDRGSRF
jgi:hypothetical protein